MPADKTIVAIVELVKTVSHQFSAKLKMKDYEPKPSQNDRTLWAILK